jgi:hypothetical protein
MKFHVIQYFVVRCNKVLARILSSGVLNRPKSINLLKLSLMIHHI